MRKLFVGSLNINVTEDDLKEYFGDFGEIEDTTIHRYKICIKLNKLTLVCFMLFMFFKIEEMQ